MKWEELTKIAVSGSRHGFREHDLVTLFLDKYVRENFESTEDVIFITGGAIGVDAAVERMCIRRGYKNLIINARWQELDKIAGPRRNNHIVDLADEFFAFWDGGSHGTANAIKKAKRKGICQRVFTPKELRRELGVRPPVKVRLPSHVSGRDISGRGRKINRDSIASLVKDIGGMKEFKKIISKKKYNPLEDHDFDEKNGRFDD